MDWAIDYLEYINDSDKGVIKVQWRCVLTDGEYIAKDWGKCELTPDPSSPSYVPYEELTEDIVMGWLHKTLDVDQIQQNLQAKIDSWKNPTTKKGRPF